MVESNSVAETPSTMQWWTLAQEGPAAIAETLDDPRLPERLVTIELLRHHAADKVAQLLIAAGLRKRRSGGGGSRG